MGIDDIRLADFTGRARIRHAALQLFAAQGYAQTSLRSIAQKADVSLALISHHFGSKHQLRDAVDAWVLAMFERASNDVVARCDGAADDGACEAFADAIGQIVGPRSEVGAYLRRMAVVEATPNGMALIGSILTLIQDVMKRSRRPCTGADLAWRSFQFLLLALGPALLAPMLQRCMPELLAEPTPREQRPVDLQMLQRRTIPSLLPSQSGRATWPTARP